MQTLLVLFRVFADETACEEKKEKDEPQGFASLFFGAGEGTINRFARKGSGRRLSAQRKTIKSCGFEGFGVITCERKKEKANRKGSSFPFLVHHYESKLNQSA